MADKSIKGKQDRELEEYRSLMEPPEQFEDGFSWKSVIGALFLGLLIMPGAMYLSLVVGPQANMQEAGRWVTIILFAEIARRSFKELKAQEIYVFYFMAGLMMYQPFQGLLWRQYFVRSDYAHAIGVAQEVPSWWAPASEVIREQGHTFFTPVWIAPILIVVTGLVVTRLNQYGLGYILYRLTNDVEELPFPMAPVAASGITALAESRENKEPWRWRCFSIGGVFGLLFGAVYIGVPAVTGALLATPLQLIPIPWIDLTPALSKVLPATGINISFNMALLFVGMVIPFWAVIGGVVGVLITMVFNPVLYKVGILSHWNPQMDVVNTLFINNVDFYLSFSIGLTLAITAISLGKIFRPIADAIRSRRRGVQDLSRRELERPVESGWRKLLSNNTQRGDFSIWIALALYVGSSALWIGLSSMLIDDFPWKFFVVYAAVVMPLFSYATAKIEGLCGQALQIPYIREGTFILSGYKGVQIWFAPIPMPQYGQAAVNFRVLELTGTKIKSQVKTQLVTLPIVLLSLIVFSELLWKMADVPSAAYPFAQKMWDLHAKMQCLTFSATMEGGSLFMEALKARFVAWGLVGGVATYALLSLFGLPTLLVFGVVRGLGQGTPASFFLELIGALIGRFYFRKRFGDMWRRYTPVLLAGFSCGMGLIGMVAVAFTILHKMMSPLIY